MFLASLHVLAWSVFLGGAIVMEFVLRHAQVSMPGAQVAIVCQKAGRRYRWWSALCLALLLVTGIPLAGPIVPGSVEAIVVKVLGGLWVALVLILALLSFYIHPELHIRVSPSMSEDEVKEERRRVGRAIIRMDITVRIELALGILAVLFGASFHV
jgi:uncharacterized membrane protein